MKIVRPNDAKWWPLIISVALSGRDDGDWTGGNDEFEAIRSKCLLLSLIFTICGLLQTVSGLISSRDGFGHFVIGHFVAKIYFFCWSPQGRLRGREALVLGILAVKLNRLGIN